MIFLFLLKASESLAKSVDIDATINCIIIKIIDLVLVKCALISPLAGRVGNLLEHKQLVHEDISFGLLFYG